jgi:KaiC/GvpD/RAD55 family RecA-like ATPase
MSQAPRGDVGGTLGQVLANLQQVRRAGRGFLACCPAHDDRSPSLNVTTNDRGDVIMKCYAGCEFGDVVAAIGMKPEQLFADYDPDWRPPTASGTHERPSEVRRREPPAQLTLADFARHKQLDPALCERMGVRDCIYQGRPAIEFAFPLRAGGFARAHVRLALTGSNKWRYRSGDTVAAYEPDLGERARQTERLVVVEGESDVLTLLSTGFGALGIPGADTAKLIEAHHLEGIAHVFVVREPDQGGETFARKVPLRLDALGFQGGVHVVELMNGAKDVSALYQRDPGGFAAAFGQHLDRIQEPPPKSRALADLFDELTWDGVVLSTGLEVLDRALDDGGLTTGTLTVLLGGPGSKKTGLATQLADVLSRQGAAVLMLCADEPRKRVAQRLGQRAGWNRGGLRAKDDAGHAIRAGAREREAALDRMLRLCDPRRDDEAKTLEEAFDELRRMRDARARVLIVDSLQTCQCLAAQAHDDPRAKVDVKLAVLKSMTDAGLIVIVVSETNRAFYAGETKTVEREHVLAAAKESGGIEYAADLLAGLVKDRAAPDRVELLVAKSRIGQEPRFWMRWNRDDATLYPAAVDDPADARPTVRELEARAELDEVKRMVLAAVGARPGLSKSKLRALVGRNKAVVFDAVDALIVHGLVRARRANEYVLCTKEGALDGVE